MLKLKIVLGLSFCFTGSVLAQVSTQLVQQVQQDSNPQSQQNGSQNGSAAANNVYSPNIQPPTVNPPYYIRDSNGNIMPANANPSAYNASGSNTNSRGQTSAAITELEPPAPIYIKKPINIPDQEIQKAAISSMMQDYFGISPEEIIKYRQAADERAKAAATLPVVPPKPVTRTINIPLTPGTPPQIIRTFVNNSTSMVVTDSSGTAWPVLNFSVGNENAFDVKRLDVADTEKQGTSGGSMFSIIPKIPYAQSNLVLALKGLNTPVVVTLLSSQKEVDYRADLRVLARGPNTVIYQQSQIEAPNSGLLSILDGVPTDSQKLDVSGDGDGNTMAWLKDSKMIIKTNMKILSPASTSFVQSPDGTSVYEFMPTGTLLAMKDGKFININVSGW